MKAEAEGRVIVKFKAESSLMRALSASAGAAPTQQAQALGARLGLNLSNGRAIAPRMQVVKGQGMNSRDLAALLAAQTDVEYAVVDRRVHAYAAPNDPLFGAGQGSATPAAGQWYLRAPTATSIVDATSVLSAINAQAAWDITTGSANVIVAVLDTGVRLDHPDLAPKLVAGYDFVHDTPTANDGDGLDSDPSDPGDFGCEDDKVFTSSWHGTQTAGLIGAATDNGTGMASVGRNVRVQPVRVLGRCGGFDSDIQAAMLWAANLPSGTTAPANATPANVINLSLGAPGTCNAAYTDVVSRVTAHGVVIVAAAGNDGLAVGSPANCAGVIAVAGVRHAGTKVGYSDLGPEVALAAPAGNCVNTTGTCLFPLLTTSNKGTTTPIADADGGSIYTDGGTDASLGTSFSAPLVSGTVGLMLSANPALTPTEVLAALKATVRPFPSSGFDPAVKACTAPTATAQDAECYCTNATCGAGLLDAGAAVAAVAGSSAKIGVASTTVVAGSSVALDGSASRATFGSTITSYAWAVTSGAEIAAFTSATNAATATLLPASPGTVTVSLTITDDAGQTSTTTTTLTVNAPSSGGGGGATGFGWLLGWLVAMMAVWAMTPRRRA